MGIISFFKKSFRDMKEDAKAQHEVDRANFAAVKAESRADFEEARAMGRPEARKAIVAEERAAAIKAAEERTAKATARTEELKKK